MSAQPFDFPIPLMPDANTPEAAAPPALEALDVVLSRLRAGESIDAATITDLAVASFEAGRAAAEASETRPPARAIPESTAGEIPPANLTPRRLEVLRLVARGLTNDEIGQILGISRLTVKSHLSRLFTSLEVTNRTEAAFALQRYEAQVVDPAD